MESENEVIKKYLPMIFELDFNMPTPAFVSDWRTMTWSDFQKESEKKGVNLDACKIRDWKNFFFEQHEILSKLEENKLAHI